MNTPSQSEQAYRQNAVLSSSPERLVPVLYEHLLINVRRGILHVRHGDIEGKFNCLTKASDIVAELMASLDFEAGGELAEHLSALYSFWMREIAIAGRDLDPNRLERIADMITSLLEAWEEAARVVERSRPNLLVADGTA